MKVSTHVILQVLGFVISIGTMLQNGAILPAKYEPYVVGLVSLAQGALAWYNHYFNPDGTPVKS